MIDEYDVPLNNAYHYDFYDQMCDFLGGFLSIALKTNNYLHKAVLSGCLRIAKESIFTGLNNFNVFSILDKKGADCYGFTQKEIDELLLYYDLSDKNETMKEWYNGYLFGNKEIYNPWSTLYYVNSLLVDRNEKAISYWANTSSNDIVYHYIQNGDQQMKEDFDKLIQGRSITKKILHELTYREMDDINNIYSFLLFTGYLKILTFSPQLK